jgi:hypothetical protein
LGYWDERYRKGRTSGEGSVGRKRAWKWDIIKKYARNIEKVVDVGCGDLSFWEGLDCENYTGIDISSCVIAKNNELRPNWKFICSPAEEFVEGVSGDIVLCMDVLFHIMSDSAYERILRNLTQYSNEWIFIHTWSNNPFRFFSRFRRAYYYLEDRQPKNMLKTLSSGFGSDGVHQKYRKFEDYLAILEENRFEMLAVEKDEISKLGALYIFRKVP